jgi:hypothetical protein
MAIVASRFDCFGSGALPKEQSARTCAMQSQGGESPKRPPTEKGAPADEGPIMHSEQIENHRAREQQCIASAKLASTPSIAKIHLMLARLHAAKLRELEGELSYQARSVQVRH